MVKTVKKRWSDPGHTGRLIGAIKHIRYQKQVPNLERIARIMLREHEMDAMQVEKELNHTVKDGLVELYIAITKKGANTGMEQEAYRIPLDQSEPSSPAEVKVNPGSSTKSKPKRKSVSETPGSSSAKETLKRRDTDDTGHDWYCFECKKSELLIECAECWRSWHSDCTDIDVTNPETFVCATCQEVNQDMKKTSTLSRKYLNTLLGYALLHLRDKARELYHLPPKDEAKRWNDHVYNHMDLCALDEKTQGRKYTCPEQFVADAKTVTHNVTLAYGAGAPLSQLAVHMLESCLHEIEEIRLCHNCYYMSNLKPPDWFCQPCDPPHELVYAKQIGFSFWPAKVIYVNDDEISDVRFFGGYHQRANVPQKHVKPITTSIQEIAVKRTAGFTKACGELEKHKQLLASDKPTKYAFSDSESDNETENADDDDDDKTELKDDKSETKDDTETLRVSSSSPRKAEKKIKKKDQTVEDGNHQVTSSEDNIPAKRKKTVETASVHCQTKERKTATKTCQTDKKMDDNLCDCGPACHREMEEGEITSVPDVEMITPAGDKAEETPSPTKPDDTKDAEVTPEETTPTKPDPKLDEDEREKAMQELREKLQKDFEEDKQQAISRAMANMQRELERTRKQAEDKCKELHAEEMKKITTKHKELVSVIKHKQWCYNCELEAMYHCCWNTSYCSIKCQQEHWHKEHKRVCRRKR